MNLPSAKSPLERFIETVSDCLEAFTAALLLSDSAGRCARLVSFHSLSDQITPDVVIRDGQGAIGWVLREQRPLNITRFKEDSRALGIYSRDAGIKAFLAVPLPDRRGILMVDSKNRFAFTEKHERILKSLAHSALHLLNVEQIRHQSELLAGIVKWQMDMHPDRRQALSSLMGVLGLDICLLARRLAESPFYTVDQAIFIKCNEKAAVLGDGRFRVDMGLCGWIIKHRNDIMLDRFAGDQRLSYLVSPDEPFDCGPIVIGLHFPQGLEGIDIDYACVFSGKRDVMSWPANILDILRFLLKDWVSSP